MLYKAGNNFCTIEYWGWGRRVLSSLGARRAYCPLVAVPSVHRESVRTIYKEQFGEFFSLRNMSIDKVFPNTILWKMVYLL